MRGDVVVERNRRLNWAAWGAWITFCAFAGIGCQPEDVGAGVSSDALEERMNVVGEGPSGQHFEPTRVQFAGLLANVRTSRRDAADSPLAGLCASGPSCVQPRGSRGHRR